MPPSRYSLRFAIRTGVRCMPGRSEIRRELYERAKKAFTAAGEAAKEHLVPGSPEWLRWQALCREAIDANAAYMDELARPDPDTHP